jgi:hypothetical protein
VSHSLTMSLGQWGIQEALDSSKAFLVFGCYRLLVFKFKAQISGSSFWDGGWQGSNLQPPRGRANSFLKAAFESGARG